MFEVTVGGQFVASHQLCWPHGTVEPPHEHTWNVKATVRGNRLDEAGLLIDFGVVRQQMQGLLGKLDQRNLNRLPPFTEQNPSAENVAAFLAGELAASLPTTVRLLCVEVEEEPGCIARYFPAERR